MLLSKTFRCHQSQVTSHKSQVRGQRILFSVFCFLFSYQVIFAQSEFVYDAKGRRNPFIPLVTAEGRLLNLDKQEEASSGAFVIEGIIYDKNGRSFAIVNGAVIGVGDGVGDYQVLKVEENMVIFIKDGEPLEVVFNKEDNK